MFRERDTQDVRAAWFAIAKSSAYTIQQENGLPAIFSHDKVIRSNKNEQIMTPKKKIQMDLVCNIEEKTQVPGDYV